MILSHDRPQSCSVYIVRRYVFVGTTGKPFLKVQAASQVAPQFFNYESHAFRFTYENYDIFDLRIIQQAV